MNPTTRYLADRVRTTAAMEVHNYFLSHPAFQGIGVRRFVISLPHDAQLATDRIEGGHSTVQDKRYAQRQAGGRAN
jgi:hypothetical protein